MAILLKDITVDGIRKDMLIDKGLIARIEPQGSSALWPLAGDLEIMDCRGKVAIPAFVNMHTHSPMTLMRGIGEDIAFQQWLSRIWKVEESIDYDYVYWATKVACLEMIRSGCATFNYQYWFFEASVKACEEMGLRIATGYDVMDKMDPAEAERQKEQCIAKTELFLNGKHPGLIYELNFHAIYSVSEQMMLWVSDYAKKNNLNLHIHLSETRKEVEDCKALHGGLSPVEYLDRLGILSDRLIAAHTLWISPRDIELLGKRGVSCVHNINSNTKLSSGYCFRYKELQDAGANVCIGTDGCASSNNLDMLEAMKTSALFQKAWRDDPSAMPLDTLMDMATINGAKALRINSGVLREGARADLSIIDTDSTYFLSEGPFLANLVYSAHSDCIDSLICNGRFLMREREIPQEKEILHQARKVLKKISQKQ